MRVLIFYWNFISRNLPWLGLSSVRYSIHSMTCLKSLKKPRSTLNQVKSKFGAHLSIPSKSDSRPITLFLPWYVVIYLYPYCINFHLLIVRNALKIVEGNIINVNSSYLWKITKWELRGSGSGLVMVEKMIIWTFPWSWFFIIFSIF